MAVWLHIGTEKTATSVVQAGLVRHRAALAQAGWLVPRTPGGFDHRLLSLYALGPERGPVDPGWRYHHGPGFPDYAAFEAWLPDALAREVAAAAPDHVVLADERLSLVADPAGLARLRGLLDRLPGPVHVVVYLRRQDDLMLSRYQENVKGLGETRDADAWCAADLAAPLYAYDSLLARWAGMVGADRVHPAVFEPGGLRDPSPFADFLDRIGARGVLPDPATGAERRNVGVGAAAVSFLRRLNATRPALAGPEEPGVRNAVLDTMAGEAGAAPLAPSQSVLEALAARCAGANAHVARVWLGRPDGVLFRHAGRHAAHAVTAAEESAVARVADRAIAALDRAAAEAPDDPARRYRLSRALAAAGRPEAAAETARRAVTLAPGSRLYKQWWISLSREGG